MPKKIIGRVTSDAADKTITITVTSRETHPIYRKQYTVSRKYAAHDEKNQAKKGDIVEVSESRPFSKTKVWKFERIVETGHAEIELKEEQVVTEIASKKAVKKSADDSEEAK